MEISAWLYDTQVSTVLRDTSWVIPATQSVHIIAISAVVGAALVSDLRLAGVLAVDESPSTVVRRHLPWMWAGLVVLLFTGLIMAIAEPERVIVNPVFWLKMALVLTAFTLTLLFRRPLLNREFSLQHARWANMVKPFAWLSLAIWAGAIICGRWIAYVV